MNEARFLVIILNASTYLKKTLPNDFCLCLFISMNALQAIDIIIWRNKSHISYVLKAAFYCFGETMFTNLKIIKKYVYAIMYNKFMYGNKN